jgi:hypothetical protein
VLTVLTSAMLLLGAGTIAAAAPAGAAVTLAQCVGSERGTYDPAVTDTPQAVGFTSTASYTCVLPLLESVNRTRSGTSTLSCASLISTAPGTDTLSWSNGGTSTYSFTRTLTTVNGVIVLTRNGTVISGRYQGATVIETVSLGTLDLTACTGDGIESADYVNTLTIAGL